MYIDSLQKVLSFRQQVIIIQNSESYLISLADWSFFIVVYIQFTEAMWSVLICFSTPLFSKYKQLVIVFNSNLAVGIGLTERLYDA